MATITNDSVFLLNLPPELILGILLETDPIDVARFARTCKEARIFAESPALWRELFLHLFDSPTGPVASFDFRLAVQQRIAAREELRHVVEQDGTPASLSVGTLQQLVAIAEQRPPHSGSSRNASWLTTHIPSTFLRNPAPLPNRSRRTAASSAPTDPVALQLAAQLHTLATPSALTLATHELRTAAREIVYETQNCTRQTSWGPFKSDGGVDWVKLEALSVVMGAGLQEAETMGWGGSGDDDDAEDEGAGIIPRGWESTRAGAPVSEGRDWAGIEDGEWRGTYQFLDYRAFEHFNFHRSSSWKPTLEDENEAVGDCMSLKLRLLPPGELPTAPDQSASDLRADDDDGTSSDDSADGDYHVESSALRTLQPQSDSTPPTSSPEGSSEVEPPKEPTDADSRPPLSFIGTSEPLHFHGTFTNAAQSHTAGRSIRGTARMTKEGHVHWRFIIRYAGADQWLMNAVQVGGPRSQFGVIGYWSTADHDEAGPIGPFHYFPYRST